MQLWTKENLNNMKMECKIQNIIKKKYQNKGKSNVTSKPHAKHTYECIIKYWL